MDGLARLNKIDCTDEMFRDLKLLALTAKLYMQRRDAATYIQLDKMVDKVFQELADNPPPPRIKKQKGSGRPKGSKNKRKTSPAD